ncbi:hypothetical protein [Yoonia sp.]|uniref:hypothetical protein n=1 Tax=Yoonia sp. TaxID=2212373 RepID=UPI003590102E
MLEDVFKAAEGDCEPLNALLRSGEPLTRDTRWALAMLLEGRFSPEKKRGRPRKFEDRYAFIWSPYAKAEVLVDFEDLDDDDDKKRTHKEAAQKAAGGTYPPDVPKATEDQLLAHLRKSEDQRPRPPEYPYLKGPEGRILELFRKYQRDQRKIG